MYCALLSAEFSATLGVGGGSEGGGTVGCGVVAGGCDCTACDGVGCCGVKAAACGGVTGGAGWEAGVPTTAGDGGIGEVDPTSAEATLGDAAADAASGVATAVALAGAACGVVARGAGSGIPAVVAAVAGARWGAATAMGWVGKAPLQTTSGKSDS